MTLFRSDDRSIKYIGMAGDLRSYIYRPGVKRTSDEEYRAFDYHTPVSVTTASNGFSASKRPRSSSSSSSSAHSTARFSRQIAKCRSRTSPCGTREAHLGKQDLQCIKNELKVIKNQIDELLQRLEHMGTRSRDASESRLSSSPVCGSVTSGEGSSRRLTGQWLGPEPGDISSRERQTNHQKLYYI